MQFKSKLCTPPKALFQRKYVGLCTKHTEMNKDVVYTTFLSIKTFGTGKITFTTCIQNCQLFMYTHIIKLSHLPNP